MSEMHHPEGEVTVEQSGHVLEIGLDRRTRLNGLTPKMFAELAGAILRLDEDPDLRVGVLHAHGDNFTAGLDLPKFVDGWAEGQQASLSGAGIDPFGLGGRRCSKPIVTAVQGITFTAGIEMMLATEIVVAADDCRFSQLEPRRGIMATGGATFRFAERGGYGNAMYHLLVVDEFDAAEAHRCGLVQEVVPAGTQLKRARELAAKIAELAPLAIQATIASTRRYASEGERAAIGGFADTQARLLASEDAAEGVASFVERRTARFEGR